MSSTEGTSTAQDTSTQSRWNHGELFNRMGVEIQENGVLPPKGGSGYLIADNVFVDWKNPWIDSFGISFMPQGGKNAVVRNNYISLFAPGKTAPRGGYGDGGRRVWA